MATHAIAPLPGDGIGGWQFDGMREFRCVGPVRGGRVTAVAGHPHDTQLFYFGAAAGGLWKTTDGGLSWECCTDGFLRTSAVCAVAVAPSDPNVIYIGTGETTIRNDISYGDGVYKSTDGGRSWRHLGLVETRAVAKIRVHPADPDTVYVAALGHVFGPNEERGVYRSADGGASWERTLFVSSRAGAIDLALDGENHRILYAAIWEARRTPWSLSSGGPDSGLWQSTDGGSTWAELSSRPGLPEGIKGKIGVAASPAQPGRVWALIEHAERPGLYRSDNWGQSWEPLSDQPDLYWRAWYYMQLTPDPCDPDTLYISNNDFWRSTDGGRSFTKLPTAYTDHHDLWIDPTNPRRMIQGHDGGATISFTGGSSWSTLYNQPTAQIYRIATDTRVPYWIYASQQDSFAIGVPSRTAGDAIGWADCVNLGPGESGDVAVRPDNPDIVYVGAIGAAPGGGNCLRRNDLRSGQARLITTWPDPMDGHGASDRRYRFAWTYPIVLSPHDPQTLYVAGNMVFRTTDEGQCWVPISPDLTRADPTKLQPSGGPISRDLGPAEVYCTVHAFAESPLARGLLWAGTDDGLVHHSRDGGQSWREVTPPELPEWTVIHGVEPSPFDPGGAYLAATRYKLDDYSPYLFKTDDYGQTWRRINTGIAADAATRVVRADPWRRGLLFAGTETGLYLSLDDGESWQPFQLNLPVAPIYDLAVNDVDLIVATHGRSIWILDDLSPLRALGADPREGALFLPMEVRRRRVWLDEPASAASEPIVLPGQGSIVERRRPDGAVGRVHLGVGENPTPGLVVTYWLPEAVETPVTLRVADEAGAVVHAVTEGLPTRPGWNRYRWNLRSPVATPVRGDDAAAKLRFPGPTVVPGRYLVSLRVGQNELCGNVTVTADPGSTASLDDLRSQHELLERIHGSIDRATRAINELRDLRAQLDGWVARADRLPDGAAICEQASALRTQLLALESAIFVPGLRPGRFDLIRHGLRLLSRLGHLFRLVETGDYAPTDQARAAYEATARALDARLAALDMLQREELAALNTTLRRTDKGPLLAPPR